MCSVVRAPTSARIWASRLARRALAAARSYFVSATAAGARARTIVRATRIPPTRREGIRDPQVTLTAVLDYLLPVRKSTERHERPFQKPPCHAASSAGFYAHRGQEE